MNCYRVPPIVAAFVVVIAAILAVRFLVAP